VRFPFAEPRELIELRREHPIRPVSQLVHEPPLFAKDRQRLFGIAAKDHPAARPAQIEIAIVKRQRKKRLTFARRFGNDLIATDLDPRPRPPAWDRIVKDAAVKSSVRIGHNSDNTTKEKGTSSRDRGNDTNIPSPDSSGTI
jgi:hypothetical protein